MRRWLLLFVLVLGGAGCGWFGSKKEEEKVTRGPKLVGRVASISSGGKFVLIEGFGKLQVSAGAVLVTLGETSSGANLYVTGEKLGAFVAADVRSGEVRAGDLVYARGVSLDQSGEAAEEGKVEGGGERKDEVEEKKEAGASLQKFQSQVVDSSKFQKISMGLG